MVLVLINFLQLEIHTQETMSMGNNKARVNILGKMGKFTLVNLKME